MAGPPQDTEPTPSKELDAFHEAFQTSIDFCQPHFEIAQRLYSLARGKRPWQLDGTFSKIMINAAHATRQDRMAKLKANSFSAPKLFNLKAVAPRFETQVDVNEAWLNYMMDDEDRMNIRGEFDPTLQSVLDVGTGYRMPHYKHVPDGKGGFRQELIAKDVDFFQILPAPNGGLVNPMDRFSNDATQYFFYIDWFSDDWIKKLEQYEGYDKKEAEKMLAHKPDDSAGGSEPEWQRDWEIIDGIDYGTRDGWRTRLNDIRGKEGLGKRRLVFWHMRDEMWIIGEDNYLIYKGKAVLDNGLLPLVKYSITPDWKNWFGIGCLEMIEDLIIAMTMNFNYRFDHMGRVLFPTKWIRDDVMAKKPESEFYDRPYAIHTFPRGTNITEAVWYDRAPEITQQTFFEEDRLKTYQQEISGMPNYSKGMGGAGTISNETATGIVSLIKQAEGRLSMESAHLEYNGLAQEARLILAMGDKFINTPQEIRNPKDASGWKWSEVDPDQITANFTVTVNGAMQQALNENSFQKLLAVYPLWNQDPMIDQMQLREELINLLGPVLSKPDSLLVNPAPAPPADLATSGQQAGAGGVDAVGQAQPQDMNQQTRSVANRNTVEANTGNTIPVGVGS